MGKQDRREWNVEQNLDENGARDQDETRWQTGGQAVCQAL